MAGWSHTLRIHDGLVWDPALSFPPPLFRWHRDSGFGSIENVLKVRDCVASFWIDYMSHGPSFAGSCRTKLSSLLAFTTTNSIACWSLIRQAKPCVSRQSRHG